MGKIIQLSCTTITKEDVTILCAHYFIDCTACVFEESLGDFNKFLFCTDRPPPGEKILHATPSKAYFDASHPELFLALSAQTHTHALANSHMEDTLTRARFQPYSHLLKLFFALKKK